MRRLIGAVGLAVFTAAVWAQEENVPLDKVPKPVMETANARFKGAEVTGASKETEDGKPRSRSSTKARPST